MRVTSMDVWTSTVFDVSGRARGAASQRAAIRCREATREVLTFAGLATTYMPDYLNR